MSKALRKQIVAASVLSLQKVFADSVLLATVKGRARTWQVPYLQAVQETFEDLRQQRVGGVRVSQGLAASRLGAILALIKQSSNRDRRTRSRWAAAVHAAHRAGVSPSELPKWLSEGGGVSGRARKTKLPSKSPTRHRGRAK